MMKRYWIVLGVGLLPLLVGCPGPGAPDAIVHWHKVGACNGGTYGDSYGYSLAPNHAYVIFALESVDNTQVSQDWTLLAANFYTESYQRDLAAIGDDVYLHKIGPFALIDTAIPAETPYSFSPYAYMAMEVQTAPSIDPSIEANETDYQLSYIPAIGAPGVIPEQTNSGVTPHTQDCGDIELE